MRPRLKNSSVHAGVGKMRDFCEALETLRGKIDLGEAIPYNTEEKL